MAGNIHSFSQPIIRSLCCIFLMLVSLEATSYAIQLNEYNKRAQIITEGVFVLCDSYDTETSRMTDFLNRKDSYDILWNTFEAISTDPDLDYYEFSMQPIEYFDTFSGDEFFCPDESIELLNQKYDSETITALKTCQVGRRFFEDFHVQRSTETDITFDSNYYYSDTIPVIAGQSYRSFHIVGDCFKGAFLGKDVQFRIVDFFEKGSTLDIGNQSLDLDHYLVMPMLSVNNDDFSRCMRILLSVKVEGFLKISNESDYRSQTAKLKKIAQCTGFSYSIPPLPHENNNILFLNLWQSLLLLIVSTILCMRYIDNSRNSYSNIRNDCNKAALRIIAKNSITGSLVLIVNNNMFYKHQDAINNSDAWVLITIIIISALEIYKMNTGRFKKND